MNKRRYVLIFLLSLTTNIQQKKNNSLTTIKISNEILQQSRSPLEKLAQAHGRSAENLLAITNADSATSRRSQVGKQQQRVNARNILQLSHQSYNRSSNNYKQMSKYDLLTLMSQEQSKAFFFVVAPKHMRKLNINLEKIRKKIALVLNQCAIHEKKS